MNGESNSAAPTADQLRNGHVAILDVLGWKGIWRRHGVDTVLHAVQVIRDEARQIDERTAQFAQPVTKEAMQQVAEEYRPLLEGRPPEVHEEFDRILREGQQKVPTVGVMCTETVFLSDTLVIGIWTPAAWQSQMAAHVEAARRLYLCGSIARTLQACALAPVPLAFRGTIASGDFLFDKNVILGQAVDDAAELMDEADAAIVWFTPPGFSEPPENQWEHYIDYEIPLHGGRTLMAQAVNPFYGCYDPVLVDAVFDGLLRAFDGATKVDVVIKRQNTEKFLRVARERWNAFQNSERIQELIRAGQNVTPSTVSTP